MNPNIYGVRSTAGQWIDSQLNKIGVRAPSGVWQDIFEGAYFYDGATWVPVLRWDVLPFGAWISTSNMVFQFGVSDTALYDSPVLKCMGSSTMANYMANPGEGLEDFLRAWMVANTTDPLLLNMALGGQTMFNLRTEANGGTPGRNIEWACTQDSTFIYVDEPTNWADAYDENTQVSYMMEIFTYAFVRGKIVIFSGARPRTPYTGEQARRLTALNPLLGVHPQLKYVCNLNFDEFKEPATDHTLRVAYDAGDGVHMNVTGVSALSGSITDKWPQILKPVTAFDQYEIERSAANTPPWTNIATITDMSLVRHTMALQEGYYRIRGRVPGGYYTGYSDSVFIDLQDPTANAGSDISRPSGTTTYDITGSGTAYNGATIVAYEWSYIAGSAVSLVNANTATVTVNDLTDGGSTVLQLKVTDSNGNVGYDLVTIAVEASSFTYVYFAFRLTDDTVPGATVCFGNPRTGVRTATNAGITVSTVSTAVWNNTFGDNATNAGGETVGNPVFAFTAKMTEAYMLTYQVVFDGSNYNLEFSGFTPGQIVPEIAFLGSRDDAAVGGTFRLMDVNLLDANGNEKYVSSKPGTGGAYDVKGNTEELSIFTNKVADSNGKYFAATRPVAPANASHEFGYTNAVRFKIPV